ncbi:MAG: endonuclease/exonuclease/phosphatase family protein [Planctomycetota bacterium]
MTFRVLLLMVCVLSCPSVDAEPTDPSDGLKVATFNVSLYGSRAGEIKDRLSDGRDDQAEKIAAIVQTVRPDVLLVNEVDFEADGAVAEQLAEAFFAVGRDGRVGIEYPHVLSIPSNTGLESGMDLNHNGKSGEPNDAWGYGAYPGQYAMAIFSRFPIVENETRTFQRFLWKDLPNALVPTHPKTGVEYYGKDWKRLRLSSKNHVDVSIDVNGQTVHVLASHPTPPVFDGPEDHNGCRNHDEIQFWNHYIDEEMSGELVDDAGRRGGLSVADRFVIMGDLNADPDFGDGRRDAIRRLLAHPRTIDAKPRRQGVQADGKLGQVQNSLATADFGRNGLMRVDYVLPSANLSVRDSGVFWPAAGGQDPDQARVWITATDHRLVWVELGLMP